jgi:hypothetical protein
MTETETWYVLEDGGVVHPSEVTPGNDGRLRHKSGAMVAMRGDVPSSRSVDAEAERAKVKKAPAKAEPPKNDRQMKADADEGGKYKTR